MIQSAGTSPSPSQEGRAPLVRVRGLTVDFPTADGDALAANQVGFDVWPGEMLGIVGESGCGKSVSLRALVGLVPFPGEVVDGEITWQGEVDLLQLDRKRRREMRGTDISMVFQDPWESLDPVYSVGDQLMEVLRKRARLPRDQARLRAIELLDRVGIPSANARLRDYPHQLSGGMRQRVMIAIAIACKPALLLADEPTTALDVTIQDQILSLLADLRKNDGLSIVLVSHDLGVIAQTCDRVAVMYAGRVVETGLINQVLDSPRHPYTAALIASAPRMAGGGGRPDRLRAIDGTPPSIGQLPTGCTFAPRCVYARDVCADVDMSLDKDPSAHASACPIVDASRAPGRS
jgi:peptide/nickel transport system ATP-binding protein